MLSFHVKFVQTDRRTDRQMEKGKTICPRSFGYGSIKIWTHKDSCIGEGLPFQASIGEGLTFQEKMWQNVRNIKDIFSGELNQV